MTREVMLSLIVVVATALAAYAEPACKPIEGKFEAKMLTGPECGAPLCTTGSVSGGLEGTYKFTVTMQQESGAAIDLGPSGGFASLITFTGGIGSLTGASGQIRLRGQIDLPKSTTSGGSGLL